MEKLIFGYTWEQIRSAQQIGGSALRRAISDNGRPQATAADYALLEKHGAEYLYDNQMFGVIDRLGLPLLKPE